MPIMEWDFPFENYDRRLLQVSDYDLRPSIWEFYKYTYDGKPRVNLVTKLGGFVEPYATEERDPAPFQRDFHMLTTKLIIDIFINDQHAFKGEIHKIFLGPLHKLLSSTERLMEFYDKFLDECGDHLFLIKSKREVFDLINFAPPDTDEIRKAAQNVRFLYK